MDTGIPAPKTTADWVAFEELKKKQAATDARRRFVKSPAFAFLVVCGMLVTAVAGIAVYDRVKLNEANEKRKSADRFQQMLHDATEVRAPRTN